MTQVVLIAAIGRNGVIGRDGGLAWRDAIDARHFRDTTMGSPVIMGRKTWDSLPQAYRPLPGRRNVVVTRNKAWLASGADVAHSLDEALKLTHNDPKVYIAGGGELYAQALNQAHTLVLTHVDADLQGNIKFPAWREEDFQVTQRSAHVDAKGVPFVIAVHERRASATRS